MIKIKKISLVLLSMLFCVTMYGCGAGEKSEQKNNQEAVAAEFAKAIDKLNATPYKHCIDTMEVSDMSIMYDGAKDYYGDKLKSERTESDAIYEIKKDSDGKPTDSKYLKGLGKATMSFSDGSADKVGYYYEPGDGYYYSNEDGKKTKYKSGDAKFRSFVYKTLRADTAENVKLKTEGSKQIFTFDFKKDLRLTSNDGDWVRDDSDIIVTLFKGTITIDDSKNSIVYEEIEEFKDKKTGATLKEVEVWECSNNVPELEFPKDLNTYKEEE